MLKICTLFKRKVGATVEEYQSYWRTGHVGHIKALSEVRRYIQNHPFAPNGKWPPYDGLVELWVDDTAALKEMGKSEGFARVIEDEKVFVDRSTIGLVLTDEHVVIEGDRPHKAVKQIVMIKRKPGMSPAEFQDYWLNKHAPLVGNPPGLLRYAQSHARLKGYRDGREPTFDGIATMTYESVEAMKAARHAPGQDKVAADAANFLDASKTVAFLAHEYVWIP